jgi:hypothetical protein
MSDLANYLEAAWLDMLARAAALSAPQTWIALYTADPTDADSGTEVSGGGYARVRVFQDSATEPYWTPPTLEGPLHEIKNVGVIQFPQATAGWGEVGWFGVRDAAAAGNLLYHSNLVAPRTVNLGDLFRFEPGELILDLS